MSVSFAWLCGAKRQATSGLQQSAAPFRGRETSDYTVSVYLQELLSLVKTLLTFNVFSGRITIIEDPITLETPTFLPSL